MPPKQKKPHRSAVRHRLTLAIYIAAIFLSAALLFAVQPMFTKLVLPRLGGSPSVWSVAMVFFQAALLAGYAYAHFLMRSASPRNAVIVHIMVMVVAALWLPLSIATDWGRPPASGEAFWLLGLFAVSIGLPFFALAANAPLLQAWFARTRHPSAGRCFLLSLCGKQRGKLSRASLLSVRDRAVRAARRPDAHLVRAVLPAHRAHRRLRLCLVEVARAAAGSVAQPRPRQGAGRARCADLDRARGDPVGAARGGDRTHLHRRGSRAAVMGDPARALSRHVRGRGRQAPTDPARIRGDRAAGGDRHSGGDVDAGSQPRHHRADRNPSRGVLRHRTGLPRGTRAAPAAGGLDYRVLSMDVGGWHDRRHPRRADRAPRLQLDCGISASHHSRLPVPAGLRRTARSTRAGVLDWRRSHWRRARDLWARWSPSAEPARLSAVQLADRGAGAGRHRARAACPGHRILARTGEVCGGDRGDLSARAALPVRPHPPVIPQLLRRVQDL